MTRGSERTSMTWWQLLELQLDTIESENEENSANEVYDALTRN